MRNQLIKHLNGGEAFIPLDTILKKVAFGQTGIVLKGLPYSFYQQFYHIWMAQHDILEYCMNQDYQSQNWPDEYWPEEKEPVNEQKWQELISAYKDDRQKLSRYIKDTENDLLQPVSSNQNHTLLREILIVIEHTAYHTGQLMLIVRLLGER